MATKRRRRRRRPAPIAEIPVVEINRPKINVYGHSPEIRLLEDGSYISGCSCGWRSSKRARVDNGTAAWWNHARKLSNGYLLMNAEQETEEEYERSEWGSLEDWR